ncbi:hypothetical protein BD410DRAFT_786432 [Rickenella mellea]|uniref:DNA helicase n=1 Tax=Rickenella mellea TaxID=50990 RepID=A0A4Y7QAQ6_9AGAM|nr:hypothetical protein BD410DRAFT_786432 [Rickenella mellea]
MYTHDHGIDVAANKKAALERLKSNRLEHTQNQPSEYGPTASSSSSSAVYPGMAGGLPAQSRDATVASRFFANPHQSYGRVLVPNSSPVHDNFAQDYHTPYFPAEPPSTPGLARRDPSTQRNWNHSPDPLSRPSGFFTSPDGSHALFSRPQPDIIRKDVDDDEGELGRPRKRVNRGGQHSDVIDLVASPTSPAIRRPGRNKRRYFQTDNSLVGSSSSSDESVSVSAGNSKPRIVRGQRPGEQDTETDEAIKIRRFVICHPDKPRDRVIAAYKQCNGDPSFSIDPDAETEEETRLRRFIICHPDKPRDRVIAAYQQCNGDVNRASFILTDASFSIPPLASSPRKPDSGPMGRVAEIDQEREAAKAAAKEKAKKSLIYAKRQNLDAVPEPSVTPPRSSSPILIQPPLSPEIRRRHVRRTVVNYVIDSGTEFEYDDNDDAQVVNGKNGSDDGKNGNEDTEDYYERKTLESFNTYDCDALRELTGCTPEQALKIISLRPFETVEALQEDLGQGRKKAGPTGISPRMFEDCVEIYRGYGSVDNILADCERIGAELKAAIASWTGSSKTKGKEKTRLVLDEDLLDEGALNLHSLSFANNAKGFLSKPPSLLSDHVTLKDYQLLGVNWLNLLYGKSLSCILADEMGLGKTVQVISFFAHLKANGCKGPHLVVVPSSTLENWCREFERFAPSISVQTYYAGKEERPMLRQTLLETRQVKSKTGNGWEVLITTYNLANGDERDRKFFRKMDWNTCVFDEGHVLKNFQSQRYQALMRIGSKWKLLLTGTPLQNNLQELVSLMNFILPNHFSETLESLRAIFKAKGDSKVTLLAESRVSRAKKMMTPFVLRRRKDQVLKDLPKKSERIEWCEMTPLQKSIYRDALQRSRKTILENDGDGDSTPPVQNGNSKPPKKAHGNPRNKDKKYLENSSNVLMDLRKAASHPMLFRTRFTDEKLTAITRLLLKEADFKKRGAIFQFVKEDMEVMTDAELQVFTGTYKSTRKFLQDENCYLEAGKITAMLRLLKAYQAEGRRCLIFSQFTQILDILQVILKKESIKYLVLTGSTPVDVRQALVDEFTEDESITVFLLSTKAGGMGINLTAASVVIMFDHDFNPHNDRQAADRAYRIGQKRDVEIVKLVTKGTIEEDMLRLGQTKLALDEAVAGEVDDGDGKDENAPEKLMKTSLMETLRKQLENEDTGLVTVGNKDGGSEAIEVDSDLTDLDS